MATMHGALPQMGSAKLGFSTRRKLKGYAAACAASLLVLCVTLYFKPFAVLDRVTEARLLADGMHNESLMVDGHRIHYLAGGSGQPIVLVHGLGSRGSDWVGLIGPLVRSGHRVYALDLLGYGESERPANAQYSIAEETRIVEGFLEAKNLQHVDLAGWSMGGWISMVVATDMPQRVRRLVLLDSAGLRFQPSFDPILFTPSDIDQLRQLERLLSPSAPMMPAFLARAFLVRAQPEAWVIRRSVNAMLTGQNLLDHKLDQLSMPVLIVWGKEDNLTPLSMAYTIHAGVANSQLEILDNCGHLAPGLCAGRIAPNMISFLDGANSQHESQKENASLLPQQASRSSSSGFWGLFAVRKAKHKGPVAAPESAATNHPAGSR